MSSFRRMNESIFNLGDVSPQTPSAAASGDETGRKAAVGDVPLDPPKSPALDSRPVEPGTEDRARPTAGPPIQVASASRTRDRNVPAGVVPAAAFASPDGRPPRRGNAGLWTAVVLLALALLSVTAYDYIAFKRSNLTVAQLPGMQNLMNGMGHRLDATEAEMRSLTGNSQTLSAQLSDLDHKMGSTLNVARRQTEQLVADAENRMETRMNQRDQALESRLTQVESGQQHDRDQMAELQTQVDGVREQAASDDQDAWHELSELNQRANRDENRVTGIDRSLHQERQRVTFEAARATPQEIIQGVSFTLTRTAPAYRRFNGYLTLAETGQTVWLRDIGAEESVTFYAGRSPKAYDLVVTSIRPGDVAGFLVMPAHAASEVTPGGSGPASDGPAGGSPGE
jgi:predicted  nucleic acid-binding Zn-ribbon protein